ncbi:MAG: alpha/beta fold hydrolase [Anaerolineae bacterium]|nr:alpha/beta fold hydrolase [Anaerolineae bacterium]
MRRSWSWYVVAGFLLCLAASPLAAQDAPVLEAHTLEREGSALHYWLTGPEDAPLIVFTHDAGLDYHTFDPQIDVVAQEYRVLVWDVRGHGQSQPMGDGFTISSAADDLLAILDEVGAEQVVLVGLSMGSYISQELIYQHPERALALVSIGGTPLIGNYSFGDMVGLRASTAAIDVLDYTGFRGLAADTSSIVQDVRDYAFAAMEQIKREDFRTVMSAIADSLRGEEGYNIPVPTLIVYGEHDDLGPIKSMTPGWAERDADGIYYVVPDAGHMANRDNPEAFNPILLDFLHGVIPAAAVTESE